MLKMESNAKREEYLSRKYFTSWHKRCKDRGDAMFRKLFGSDRESSSDEEEEDQTKQSNNNAENGQEQTEVEEENDHEFWFIRLLNYRIPETFDPQSDYVYLFWIFLVALSFTYNACVIPYRTVFPVADIKSWMVVDYLCDLINLIDLLFIQVKIQYIESGQRETCLEKTKARYYASKKIKLDMMALFPTDIIYPILGANPIFRINRLLKMRAYVEFNDLFENVLKRAYIFRVSRTTFYLLYFIHIDACLYYWISYLYDFKIKWGYNQLGTPYIRCFYWSFLTCVNIGNVNSPGSNFELAFQLFNFFLGLFIFSVVIGQVRDSVQAATADKEAYRRKKNACNDYMHRNNISSEVQAKVKSWFEYTWDTQKILDETSMLEQLPEKMRKELAINVHIGILSKVKIFKECDRQILYDLVLRLRPILYLPGDYICRKGAVGREMYIISKGYAHVVGDDKSCIFATLKPGTAFGEISLMSIGGGNKRTANIYSPGFTTLFVLYNYDFNAVLRHHPEAYRILRRKAKQMLQSDKEKKPLEGSDYSSDSEDDKGKLETKFVQTVIKSGRTKNLKSLNKLKKFESES